MGVRGIASNWSKWAPLDPTNSLPSLFHALTNDALQGVVQLYRNVTLGSFNENSSLAASASTYCTTRLLLKDGKRSMEYSCQCQKAYPLPPPIHPSLLEHPVYEDCSHRATLTMCHEINVGCFTGVVPLCNCMT